jgi:trk system potassium uptake protein TrkA
VYIVIVGGGRVGYYLAKSLLEEKHEVLIVEEKASVCENINDELGTVCFRGDGCEAAVLAKVGTSRADILITVTGDDEDNLIACQVAKHKFNVPRVIARIRNPRNEILFKELGIDVTISSTTVILEQIAEQVPAHPLIHLHEFKDKGLEIVDLTIPRDAATAGKLLKELTLPAGAMVLLVIRKAQHPLVPDTTTVLMADDQVIAVVEPVLEGALRKALLGE